jgi:alkylation response protein AidB-like acyl-CoA dehydrogenase
MSSALGDFALSADQVMIRDAAATFLAEACPSSVVRQAMESDTGVDLALWRRIGQEMGWCATHIPEEYGGLGLGWVELVLILEQMGRRLPCVPFFSTVALAATTLLECGNAAACDRWLPGIAAGEFAASLAFGELGMAWDPELVTATARPDGAGYVLEGVYRHVPDGCAVTLLLLPAKLKDGSIGLFAVNAEAGGIVRKNHRGFDLTRRVAEVAVHEANLPPEALVAQGPELVEAMTRAAALAAIALAAEQLGGAQQCLDLALAFAAERVQFGRTINTYQAVKHRCAEMMLRIEATASAVAGAARVAQTRPATSELLLEAACVKSFASETYRFCAGEAIQLHGGVGFTWEYDPHLYFKRAQASSQWLGTPDAWRQHVADVLLDGTPEDMVTAQPPAGEGDEAFRAEIRQWMAEHLTGRFEVLRHRGGAGDEDAFPALRKEWELELARGGWTCVGWPKEVGGRGLSIAEQIIFHEEYARAGGPGHLSHLSETLLGPTLIAYGTPQQKARFLPGIVAGTDYWCQGYSEPGAGSDLANVQTRARQDPETGDWILHGQKVWTSLAHECQWIFVVARCEQGSRLHKGLIFLLVELNQPGVEVRPIRQITGTCEFNEVFFDGARCPAANVVGAPGEGWKIAMALLGFERGLSWIGMQQHFEHQLQLVIKAGQETGADWSPSLRDRIGRAWMGLKVMHYNTLRTLSGGADGSLSREGYIIKHYWSNWHRDLGELAMDVLGVEGDIEIDDFSRTRLQQVWLFSRSDTIVAGTNEIQLNIIAERALGMPKEPRPEVKPA